MAKYRRLCDGVVVDAKSVEIPTVVATHTATLKGSPGDWLVSEEVNDGKNRYGSSIPGVVVPKGIKQFFVTGETFKIMYELVEGQS